MAVNNARVKDGVRRILVALGLRVQFQLKVSKRERADRDEVQALMSDLLRLESLPTASELTTDEVGEPVVWNAKKVRKYLDDERILLFHDVIEATKNAGIEFAGKSVADVGSGTGYMLRLIAGYGPARLVGYDQYNALNIVASVICPTAEIVAADLFAQPSETYDVVFCMETLEHQVDPMAALHQLVKYVVAGGALILTVPDGRKDTAESAGKYPGGAGYYGHINFWSIESFGHFVCTALGDGFRVSTRPVGKGGNLLAVVTECRQG